MNREVHYILSIQTQYYLKSAWESWRRVYLMPGPIAQCRADAGGNFRKAVARGDKNGSELSQQSTKGLIKRKARNSNNYNVICTGQADFWTETNFHTTIHPSSTCWTGGSQIFVQKEVLCVQISPLPDINIATCSYSTRIIFLWSVMSLLCICIRAET